MALMVGDHVPSDNYSSKKRKSSSKRISSKKRVTASSSKGITTTGEYIDGGTFGNYDGQSVTWKTCDAYNEQETTKMLKHEVVFILF